MNPYLVRASAFCCLSRILRCASVVRLCLCCARFRPAAQQSAPALELSRTVRTWEFLPVVGTRAGLFGNETGRFEAWVYPLKIFRDFHLTFHRRRPRAARGEPGAHADGTSRVRVDSVRRRFISRSRNALRPGERSRRRHSCWTSRPNNHWKSKPHSPQTSNWSGRPRWVERMSTGTSKAACLCVRRRGAEVCRVGRIAHRQRRPALV